MSESVEVTSNQVTSAKVPVPPKQPTRRDVDEEIERRFSYKRATPKGQTTLDAIGLGFVSLAAYLQELLPEGREKMLAIQQLETAQAWSEASIVRCPATR